MTSERSGPQDPSRPTRARRLPSALVVALRRPDLWPLGLAAFLLHGGLAVVALPFLVLPSPIGLVSVVGATAVLPTGISPGAVRLAAGAIGIAVGWLVVSGIVAAAIEAVLLRELAAELGRPRRSTGRRPAARIAAARALAAAPLLPLVAGSLARIAIAVERELLRPSDPGLALPIRVVLAAPEAPLLLAGAWLVAATLGSGAAGGVATTEDGPLRASLRALGALVRHPRESVRALAGGAVGDLLLLPPFAVAALAWSALPAAIASGLALAALASVAFVAAWTVGLAAAALRATWRSATVLEIAALPTTRPA